MEKSVMETTNHPFIMQFYRTFKDRQNVYFLLEYLPGMELFDVLRSIGLLTKSDSQFYIGTIILALEYLHSLNIVYRDLKPENLIVNEHGILYMIDMGTAKILKAKVGITARTFTIIGTPHYMAPEILSGKGYTYSADIWSVGVCLYEFMCGGLPFGDQNDDPFDIYQAIIKSTLKFPDFFKDLSAKSLIEQLMNKLPEIRIGRSYDHLKAHSFFQGFDWDKLATMEIAPPFLPPTQKGQTQSAIMEAIKTAKSVLHEIKADNLKNADGKKGLQEIHCQLDSVF